MRLSKYPSIRIFLWVFKFIARGLRALWRWMHSAIRGPPTWGVFRAALSGNGEILSFRASSLAPLGQILGLAGHLHAISAQFQRGNVACSFVSWNRERALSVPKKYSLGGLSPRPIVHVY